MIAIYYCLEGASGSWVLSLLNMYSHFIDLLIRKKHRIVEQRFLLSFVLSFETSYFENETSFWKIPLIKRNKNKN